MAIKVSEIYIFISLYYLTEDCATSTCMFDNITSQAPIHCASTHRPLSIISEDPSDEIEGSEFRFENEIEDDGNKEDDKMEGYSDEEGNEMEEGEGEYDGGCRFEKVDSG